LLSTPYKEYQGFHLLYNSFGKEASLNPRIFSASNSLNLLVRHEILKTDPHLQEFPDFASNEIKILIYGGIGHENL